MKPFRVLVAPDKFKGNMSAMEVCETIRDGFLEGMPEAELTLLPMADGGEGTVDSLTRAGNGSFHKAVVTGPLGEKVEALYGIIEEDGKKTGIMEMASASGLALIPKEKRDIFSATTYGTGELIRHILDAGAGKLVIGIGGSATNDGGAGCAQALGFRLLDAEGKEIPPGPNGLLKLASIDKSKADPRLAQTEILVACDVKNPLLGPEGAARIYGPQKGAREEDFPKLEEALGRLAALWKKEGMAENVTEEGDGAAGGLGAGLRAFCGAQKVSGAQLVMEVLKFEEKVKECDLVILGEGCTDSQTESGKICSEAAGIAAKYSKRILLLSGALRGKREDFARSFPIAFSTSTGAHSSLEEAIAAGKEDLAFTARNIAKLIQSFR